MNNVTFQSPVGVKLAIWLRASQGNDFTLASGSGVAWGDLYQPRLDESCLVLLQNFRSPPERKWYHFFGAPKKRRARLGTIWFNTAHCPFKNVDPESQWVIVTPYDQSQGGGIRLMSLAKELSERFGVKIDVIQSGSFDTETFMSDYDW